MDWFDVLNNGLDIANLAVNMNNARKINEIKQQGKSTAAIQSILSQARNEVFKVKQSADQILQMDSNNQPKLMAGAFALLDNRLSLLGLTPDLFPDFSDKEYVANVISYVKNNANQYFLGLSDVEKQEVRTLINKLENLPRLNYYIENIWKYRDYRNAIQKAENTGGKDKSGLGKLLVLVGCLSICITGPIFQWSFGNNGIFCTAIWFLGLVGYGIFLMFFEKERTESVNAVKKIPNEIDIRLMEQLDKEFSNSVKAKDALEDTNNFVKKFFGDSHLLPNQ